MKPLEKTVVLVGMMGAGKTSVGRRLAAVLSVPFKDADAEIEAAAASTITEIFARYGEQTFREGERKVVARLLAEPPHVLATGGGAFMDPGTRARIKESAVSVWLKASLDLLLDRVGRRETRPLLAGGDARATMARLLAEREPVYRQADITIESDARPHDEVVEKVLAALKAHATANENAMGQQGAS